MILSVVDMMPGTYNWETGYGLLSLLGTFIPALALGARRLHDINRTGWWQLMGIGLILVSTGYWLGIPLFIGSIVLIVWAIKPSDEGTNKHGPAPRHPTSQQPYKPS